MGLKSHGFLHSTYRSLTFGPESLGSPLPLAWRRLHTCPFLGFGEDAFQFRSQGVHLLPPAISGATGQSLQTPCGPHSGVFLT